MTTGIRNREREGATSAGGVTVKPGQLQKIAHGCKHGGPRVDLYLIPGGRYYICIMCRSAENTIALFMW